MFNLKFVKMKKVIFILTLALFAQMMQAYTMNHTVKTQKKLVKQILPCCDEDDDYGKKEEKG
jgi:hypothetical protein